MSREECVIVSEPDPRSNLKLNNPGDPDSNTVHKYVSIGLSPAYSVTVHKRTFDLGLFMLLFIGTGVIVLAIGFTFFFINESNKIKTLPPLPKTSQSDIVTSNTGGTGWISQGDYTDHGICQPQFYGHNCEREKHNKRYFSVGNPDVDNTKFNVIDTFISDGKSFNRNNDVNTCSSVCDRNKDCSGFLYEDKQCTLLSGFIETDNIPYYENSTLYMKDSKNIHFKNHIFIGEMPTSFPPRYWLTPSGMGYRRLSIGKVNKLDFFPEYIVNHTDRNAIYSLENFDKSQVDIIKKDKNNYIHKNGDKLKLPSHWKYQLPIYVLYY
ncbi:MAG: hypothetical protein QM487_05660 [Candidatus Marithrix sp.]